jgi:4-amino-4-deoxy-L-arabinose transferase-like glycosyltransferase
VVHTTPLPGHLNAGREVNSLLIRTKAPPIAIQPNTAWNKHFLLALLFSVVALFAFLGTPGLKEPDEGRYAEIGREMAASNDWLIPHLNGFEHFQKPPFVYWETAAAIKLFGVNEWAARLPAALSALGIVLLVFWIGSWFFGSKTGLVAALISVSSFEFFALGRTLNTDMALAFWTTASTLFFLRWTITPEARRWEWLSFGAMGIAFLTKGPVGLLAPLSVIVLVCIHARSIDSPLPVRWARGLLLTFAIGLSWFLAVVMIHPELARYFLGFELFQRTVGTARGREQPFWFYFAILGLGLFPWSLFVPYAFIARMRGWSLRKIARLDMALLAWILVPLIILTIIRSKLPTYVLPLYPALALLTADWICNQASTRLIGWLASISAIIALVLPCLPLLLPHLSHQTRMIELHPELIITEAVIFLCTAISILVAARQRDSLRTIFILGGGSIVSWIVAFSMLDTLDKEFGEQASVKPIATLLKSAPDLPNALIYCVGTRAHGIEFYTERLVHESSDKADLALQPAADQKFRLIGNNDSWELNLPVGKPIYLVTTRGELPKMTQKWNELGSSGSYVLLARP